jgi:hypothetical protein
MAGSVATRLDERRTAFGARCVIVPKRIALAPVLAGFVALLSPIASPTTAFARSGPPPGMVAYDKPVFKNGRRVLYHGAWRAKGSKGQTSANHGSAKGGGVKGGAPKGGVAASSEPLSRPVAAGAGQNPKGAPSAGAAAAAAPLPASPIAAPLAASWAASRSVTGAPLAGPPPPAPLVDPPTDARGARAALGAKGGGPGAAAGQRARLTLAMDARLGAELASALAPAGVDLTVVQAGAADLFLMPAPVGLSAMPAASGVVAITRLFDCEAVIVGGARTEDIGDLAGKRVAAAPESTEIGRAARRVFAAAGVRATFIDAVGAEAAAALRSGRADAYVAIAANPRLEDAPDGARLVSVPFTGAVRDQFLPAEISKARFPRLVAGDHVDTVAQPMILAARDPGGDAGRRDALTRFTDAFFSALATGALPAHKWRDVNPAAKLPLSRFEAAQAWVERMNTQ